MKVHVQGVVIRRYSPRDKVDYAEEGREYVSVKRRKRDKRAKEN